MYILIKLLPNETFKRALTSAFIDNYNFTSFTLTLSEESDKLSNRIVHISVQLLANQETVLELVHERNIFNCFLDSFKAWYFQIILSRLRVSNYLDTDNFPGSPYRRSTWRQRNNWLYIWSDSKNRLLERSLRLQQYNSTQEGRLCLFRVWLWNQSIPGNFTMADWYEPSDTEARRSYLGRQW